MDPFTAVYSENQVIVPTQSEADSLLHDGYGYRINKTHILWSVEALYNAERGKITVIDEVTNTILSFQELLHRLSENDFDIWVNFMVYKDLRTRGFIIKVSENDFKVYERGDYSNKSPSYQLKIISEGKPETIKHLITELKNTNDKSLKMKIAVIDRRGEIVYYGLEEKYL